MLRLGRQLWQSGAVTGVPHTVLWAVSVATGVRSEFGCRPTVSWLRV